MKKEQLVEECKKRNLDTSGKITDLKSRLKNNAEKQNSVEELFKKYDQDRSKK